MNNSIFKVLYRDWRGGKGNKRAKPFVAYLHLIHSDKGVNIYVFDGNANCYYSGNNYVLMCVLFYMLTNNNIKQEDFKSQNLNIKSINNKVFVDLSLDGRKVQFFYKKVAR